MALFQVLKTFFVLLTLYGVQVLKIVFHLKRILGQVIVFDELLVVFKMAVDTVFLVMNGSNTVVSVVEAIGHEPDLI